MRISAVLWPLHCVTAARARQAFDAMLATSCDPQAVAPDCIPFLYPDDGALGRAHEMCRRLRASGLRPRKVWCRGTLVIATRNHPDCAVHLSLHVAPTLCVRLRWFRTRRMVIDPAFFTEPVPIATWQEALSDPSATLTETGDSMYDLVQGFTDPSYELSDQSLADAKAALQDRTSQVGPPPYAGCP